MTETWGWFIDIEKENENLNYKNQFKNTILHNIQETIYEEKEYYIQTNNKKNENQSKNDAKNTFPYNTYFKRTTNENLSKIIDPFTLILLTLFVSGYILIVN